MEMFSKPSTLTDEEKAKNNEITKNNGGSPITPEQLDVIFDQEDRDKDGLLNKKEFYASQCASFAHQKSMGLKVTEPTQQESFHFYDDYWNKVSPGVEGVSKLDWKIFRLVVKKNLGSFKEILS
jgi:hypothetical protein